MITVRFPLAYSVWDIILCTPDFCNSEQEVSDMTFTCSKCLRDKPAQETFAVMEHSFGGFWSPELYCEVSDKFVCISCLPTYSIRTRIQEAECSS